MDAVFDKTAYLEEFWSYGKLKGFEVSGWYNTGWGGCRFMGRESCQSDVESCRSRVESCRVVLSHVGVML